MSDEHCTQSSPHTTSLSKTSSPASPTKTPIAPAPPPENKTAVVQMDQKVSSFPSLYPAASQENTTTSVVDKERFTDPITSEIMGDPVSCADGFIYERSTLEKHFQVRREMNQDIQVQSSDTQNRTAPSCTSSTSPPSCGASCGRSIPIQVTSLINGGSLVVLFFIQPSNWRLKLLN